MARRSIAAAAGLAAFLSALGLRAAPRLLAYPAVGGGVTVLLAGVGTSGTTTPGGRRNVGRLFAENLVEMGASVGCVARTEAAAEELRGIGCQVVAVGDLMDPAFASEVVTKARPSTVFSAVGGKDRDGKRVDGVANINLFRAAAEMKAPPHVVFVTSWGCGETWDFVGEETRQFLGPALRAKTEAEEFLRTSGLRFLIVRPGGLMPSTEPPTRRGVLIRGRPDVGGAIRRQDLAQMLLWLPRREDTNGLALTAVDMDMSRADPPVRDDELVALAPPG